VLEQARGHGLLSSEHFSVDGTLIEAWASHKSFRPKSKGRPNSRKKRRDRHRGSGSPKNPTVSFRGERRLNDTHASTTDPDAQMARLKGKEAKLAYRGHVLIENRHGLVTDARLTQATGTAEWEAGLAMLGDLPGDHRGTAGGDRGYDTTDFDAPRRLSPQPATAQGGGGGVRLDEDSGTDAQDETPRERSGRLDVRLHGGGLQPGADAQPAGGNLNAAVFSQALQPAIEARSTGTIPEPRPTTLCKAVFNSAEPASQSRNSAPC